MGYTSAYMRNVTKILASDGLRVWQLDDVGQSLLRPTLTCRYNELQRSKSSSSSRHIQHSVPDRRYTGLP